MEFRVLGPLEVRDAEETLSLGGFRQRLVLAVLVLYPGRPLSIDWLIDAVWGEEPPRTSRKTLQVYASRLRRLLGPASIEAGAAGYQLRVPPGDIDSRQFEDLASEGRRLLPSDPQAAAETLRAALSLWRGMPWGELGDEPAIQPEAQRLRELRLAAIGDRITAELESGLAPALVGELEGLVEEYPLREGFRAQLMLALYRSGRQADALRLYQDTRRLLGEELGIEPSPDLRDLEERILLQDASIDGPAVPSPAPDWTLTRNPYKGLSSFREEDAEDFFGRTDLVAELGGRVHSSSLVAAVGASGAAAHCGTRRNCSGMGRCERRSPRHLRRPHRSGGGCRLDLGRRAHRDRGGRTARCVSGSPRPVRRCWYCPATRACRPSPSVRTVDSSRLRRGGPCGSGRWSSRT